MANETEFSILGFFKELSKTKHKNKTSVKEQLHHSMSNIKYLFTKSVLWGVGFIVLVL